MGVPILDNTYQLKCYSVFLRLFLYVIISAFSDN